MLAGSNEDLRTRPGGLVGGRVGDVVIDVPLRLFFEPIDRGESAGSCPARPLIDHCIRFCYREQQPMPTFWALPVTMSTITKGGVTRWRENGADQQADPALSRPVSSELRGRPR
jgi:hypothetical protein